MLTGDFVKRYIDHVENGAEWTDTDTKEMEQLTREELMTLAKTSKTLQVFTIHEGEAAEVVEEAKH